MPGIGERFKNGWNAFLGRDPTKYYEDVGVGSGVRPDRPRYRRLAERQITNQIYNMISVSCSMVDIRHARVDEDDNYVSTIKSTLNYALSKSANVDETGRELIRDSVNRMLLDGTVAIVPVLTDIDPLRTDSYKVIELRAGRIMEWYPKHVRVEVYNEDTGFNELVLMEKRMVTLIENPFYQIMNEPSSTGARLMRTLNQLDRANEFSSSDKLDLIVQLPYNTRSPAQQLLAKKKQKEIEEQLTTSKRGIAYIDGTDKVVQLNRSLENNLWVQAKELEERLYNQLGFTQNILNGTASEEEQLNYSNRIIDPIMSALTEEMERKFLSRTAVSQGQSILYFLDPFRLVPVAKFAELADKLTRNEIMSSNELRAELGLKPSDNPMADELVNSNLNHPNEPGLTENINEDVVNVEEPKYPEGTDGILNQMRQTVQDDKNKRETESASILEQLRQTKQENDEKTATESANILELLRRNKNK